MKTLVTGGAGFIGTHLVQELVARGDHVVVLDSLEGQVHDGATPDLLEKVELHVGDVGDTAIALRRAGVPIRIEDHGIAACDPDQNAWCVRFEPSARGRAVVETGRSLVNPSEATRDAKSRRP